MELLNFLKQFKKYLLVYFYLAINIMQFQFMGFPGGTSGKEPNCQCRRFKRCGFDPWVGKIPNVAEQLRWYTTTTQPVL